LTRDSCSKSLIGATLLALPGEGYELLTPVYLLNIINQPFSGQSTVWYHHYRLSHQLLPGKFMEGLEFVSIELPNFIPANYRERKLTALWLRFLKDIKDKSTMIPEELLEVPEIAEAVEALKESSYSPEELEKYEKYWDILRTQQTFVNDARREGEDKKAKFAAQKLFKRRFSNEDISEITSLGTGEIEALQKEMN